MVKDPNLVNEWDFHAPFGKSHHQIIYLNLNIKATIIETNIEKHMYTKGRYDEMRKKLTMSHDAWDMLLSEEDSIDKWVEKNETLVKKPQEEFVPKKS